MNTLRFLKSIDTIRKSASFNPSYVKITTITITSTFGEPLNIPMIREYFESSSFKIKNKQTGHEHIWAMSPTSFYNQMSIFYTDGYSTKSAKLFPNGSIQVAGCSDLYDCERILSQLAHIVSTIFSSTYRTFGYDVHMINTNFSLNFKVNLYSIFEKFDEEHEVAYNPDRYSAVKIKIRKPGADKSVTVSIFGSGKVIITGARTLDEIRYAYETIMAECMENYDLFFSEDAATIEKFDTFRGANISEWLEKI